MFILIKFLDKLVGLQFISSHPLDGHKSWVQCVAYSPDGRFLASGSGDTTVRIWDPKTRRELKVLKEHSDTVYCVSFDEDTRLLASGSVDGTVKIWDVETGMSLRTLNDSESLGVLDVDFSPGAKWLAAACGQAL